MIVNGVAVLMWICQGCGRLETHSEPLEDATEITTRVPDAWAMHYDENGNHPQVFCDSCGRAAGYTRGHYATWVAR